MHRIGSTISAFQLRMIRQLDALNRAIDQSNRRLSTGKRINSAADDPAGLVAAALLRSEQAGVEQAMENVQATRSLVDTADAALAEIVTQLTTIRTKAVEAAGGTLTQSELEANQAVIDAAVAAIDLAAGTTTYNGKSLLDGSQDFVVTGINNNQVDQVVVLDRNTDVASQTIDVNVTVAAEQAQLTYAGKNGSKVKKDATFVLTGNLGSTTVTVTKDEKLSDVRDRINLVSDQTGVTASVSGNDLLLTSTAYGSDATVVVQVTSGQFDVTGGNGDGTANGVDADGTINGSPFTARGLKIYFRSPSLDVDLQLDSSFGTGAVDTMTVSGSALSFRIDSQFGRPAVLSLQSMRPADLGGVSGRLDEVVTGGGKSLLDGDAATTVDIVDEALAQVTVLQARVGAFSGQLLETAENVLTGQQENLAETVSAIEDADTALETALLARNQLLADSTAAALAIAADRDASLLTLLQAIAYG